MPYTALLDANVLHPMVLCDFLMRLAIQNIYRARWSLKILEETAESVIRRRTDLDPERIRNRIMVMNAAIPDAMVSNHEHLESTFTRFGTDAHVVAAAVVGRVDCIVTSNTRDFDGVNEFGIEVRSADDFLMDQFSLAPETVLEVLTTQAAATRKPPLSLDDVLDRLARVVPQFVTIVKRYRSTGSIEESHV